MDAKPSDFFVGVIDFFAVLLPGAAATFLLRSELTRLGTNDTFVKDLIGAQGAAAWIAFLFSSYLIGNLIFLLGSKLDGAYDRWRRLTKDPKDDLTFKVAKDIYNIQHPKLADSSLSTLKWAKAYVKLRSPDARPEIDGYEASSKFFRSLVVLFVLLAIYVGFKTAVDYRFLYSAGSLVLAWLCFLRNCDQRWKFTESAYTYAIAIQKLESEKQAGQTVAAP